MFVLLSRYLKPLDEVDRVLADHRAFLERHYQAHHLLTSGPQNPRTGGVIVTHDLTREQLEAMLAEDPFTRHGIAEYEVVEFTPTRPINP
ncbi:MAG TPA: YciI family protein [Candidatus Acidoferrales bacterium]|nr:YciI family protein [Candidatus Acidoferrales bacterium]